MKRDVLIVGSVPLSSAEEVMRTIGKVLGSRVSRIPDGETGARLRWIDWQTETFDRHPMLQRAPDQEGIDSDWRNKEGISKWKNMGWHMIREDVDPATLEFPPLGYARTARESYEVFRNLRDSGALHATCRFQVSLPTPYNVIDQRIVPNQRLQVEKAYERRMIAEISEMSESIPHNDLSIQWDVAHEIENLDGARPHWFGNPEQGIIDRLVRLGANVPRHVELGFHFCYGDFAHKHIVEPKDAGLMVSVANKLLGQSERSVDWIHFPVPRERSDDAFFSPFAALSVPPETRIYLGLIHFTDGLLGARRRLAAAKKVITIFGVATECGFGRRPPDTIVPLLQLHTEVADLKA